MVKEWLVFFTEGDRPSWWDIFTRPGFRHVAAAGCDADQKLWLFYDPSRDGTEISAFAWDSEEANQRLGQFMYVSSHCLRVVPRRDLSIGSPMYGCVGAMKALLGVRSRALAPFGLYRHLLSIGAEKVELPHESAKSSGPAGRPCCESDAGSRTAACGGGQAVGNAAAASGRNSAPVAV